MGFGWVIVAYFGNEFYYIYSILLCIVFMMFYE